MIDPENALLEFDAADEGEPSLTVRETYPTEADVSSVHKLYADLLADHVEARVEKDERGRPVVEATATADDPAAQVVAARVALGLAERALERDAIQEARESPRGYE